MSDKLANFIAITNCQDPKKAEQFLDVSGGNLENAVALFFDIGENGLGGNPTPSPPQSNNFPSNNSFNPPQNIPNQNNQTNFESGMNKLIEENEKKLNEFKLTEQEKYLVSQIEHKKNRHEKASNNQSFFNLSSFWSKTKNESEEFLSHIKKPKIECDHSKEKFEKILKTFDQNIQKPVLIIYIHNVININSFNNYLVKNILNNLEVSQFINMNFQFYPILSNSKSLKLIEDHFNKRDVPGFLFFRWDLDNKLFLIKKTKFDDYATPDLVFQDASEVLEISEQIKSSENATLRDIDEKKESFKRVQKENEKRMEEYMRNPRSQNNPPPPPQPQMNPEYDQYRYVREQQEQKMKEMLELEKQKEEQRKKEEHKKDLQKLENLKIREKIFNLRQKFKNYSPPSSGIEIRARLPNGKRISQVFDKLKTVSFVKNYFIQLEDNGILEDIDEEDEEEMEEENNMIITLMHGYPPKPLDENVQLRTCFGESEGESITIRKS